MKALGSLLGLLTLIAGAAGGLYLWSLRAPATGDADNHYPFALLIEDAAGIEPGLPIRHRGVEVGSVRRVRLLASGAGAEVLCTVEADAAATLRAASRFVLDGGGAERSGTSAGGYIYYSALEEGEPLPRGARVPLERAAALATPRTNLRFTENDLFVRILFADLRQLQRGSPVRSRGVTIGRVLELKLADDVSAIAVTARIAAAHRGAVSADSRFWIEPGAAGAGSPSPGAAHADTAADIDELLAEGAAGDAADLADAAGATNGALRGLAPPADAYEAPPGASELILYTEHPGGPPPAPGTMFLGLASRPLTQDRVADPGAALDAWESGREGAPGAGLVRVEYVFLHRTVLHRSTRHVRTSTGVLYRTRGGDLAVLVARHVVDARWWRNDLPANGEILDEELLVHAGDGTRHLAGAVWHAPEDRDLSLLRVLDGADAWSSPPLARVEFEPRASAPSAGEVELRWRQAEDLIGSELATLDPLGDIDLSNSAPLPPDALLFREGAAFGVLPAGDSALRRAVLFRLVPSSLRGAAP